MSVLYCTAFNFIEEVPMAVKKYISNLARALLGKPYNKLTEREKRVIDAMAAGEPVAQNVNTVFHEKLSVGQRVADWMAKVAGSWGFIITFVVILGSWMTLNSFILIRNDVDAFDPYPYILLNLVLSTLAALQAPVIMMSQNRQSEKDRLTAANAFEVSLKTELEIQQLHKKVDELTAKLVGNSDESGESEGTGSA